MFYHHTYLNQYFRLDIFENGLKILEIEDIQRYSKISSGYFAKAEFLNPGGSIKDQLSIDACDEAGIAMIFVGDRHFKH